MSGNAGSGTGYYQVSTSWTADRDYPLASIVVSASGAIYHEAWVTVNNGNKICSTYTYNNGLKTTASCSLKTGDIITLYVSRGSNDDPTTNSSGSGSCSITAVYYEN